MTFKRNVYYKMCSKYVHWRRSGVFIVNFEPAVKYSHLFLMFIVLWTSKCGRGSKCFSTISNLLCLQIIIIRANVLTKAWMSLFIWKWNTSTLLYLCMSQVTFPKWSIKNLCKNISQHSKKNTFVRPSFLIKLKGISVQLY